MLKHVSTYLGYIIKKDQKRTFDDDYAIFFPDFLHEGIYCGYSFELHRLVDAIQMSTHKICLYKK